jgi:hypothetical protein
MFPRKFLFCGGIARKSCDPCKKQGPKHTSCTLRRQSRSSIPLCQCQGRTRFQLLWRCNCCQVLRNARSGAVPLARNPAPRADGRGAVVLLNNTGQDWVILAASTSQSCARIGKCRRMACVVEMLTPQFQHISTEKAMPIRRYPTLKIPLSTIDHLPLECTKPVVSWNEGKGLEEPLRTKCAKHSITRDRCSAPSLQTYDSSLILKIQSFQEKNHPLFVEIPSRWRFGVTGCFPAAGREICGSQDSF